MPTRQLKDWAAEHIRAIRITIVVAMLGLALWGLVLGFRYGSGHYIFADAGWGQFLGYFLVNLGPELAGIVIGVVVIDALNDWRQTEQLKAQLIRQMGSTIKDVAVPAVGELAYHGWLYDGSLRRAYLEGANLGGVNLDRADLAAANLRYANLEDTSLEEVNLEGAELSKANLHGARLEKANLRNTKLVSANLAYSHLSDACLAKANLMMANLKSSDMGNVNLTGAYLRDASLEDVNLEMANLEGAYLWEANLKYARLRRANMIKAHLDRAYLKEAHFIGTYLTEASLYGTNLTGARQLTSRQLKEAQTLKGATMPDGIRLKDSIGGRPYLEQTTPFTFRRTPFRLSTGESFKDSDDWENSLKPNLTGPTLDEWLATNPTCLDIRFDE